ncbi:hypothetical protein GCM10008942_10860 [Rhizomicrobium electricum]|uniref:Autotransporter domain-containing protein n=1 Tax=Rhizomicrobium electricum TaxID=480070 RepID=A0ABP3PI17_9PROT
MHLRHVTKTLLMGTCASVVLAAFSPACATPDFLSFTTTGNGFTGWTTYGTTTGSSATLKTISTTDTVTLGDGVNGDKIKRPYSLAPATGQSMARIATYNSGSSGATYNLKGSESLFGLTSGTFTTVFTDLQDEGQPTNFGALTETITLDPGNYTFYWAYAAQDYHPYNDGVLFALSGNGINRVDVLADNGNDSGGGGAQAGTVVVGTFGTTQWTSHTFSIDTAGTYQLSFVAYNWGPTSHPSDRSVDPLFYIGASAGTMTVGTLSPIDTAHAFYLATNLGSTVTPDFKGGTLRVDASGIISSAFTVEAVAGNTIDAYGNSGVFSGVLSGPGGLVIKDSVGGGLVTFKGANAYSGGTTIDAGATLLIGGGGTTGSITGNVTNNGTLGFYRSDSITYSGAISGTGALIQAGTGTLILTGASAYSGGTLISSGTLQLGNGGTTGSIIGDVVDNGTLAYNRSDTIAYTGAISGSGTLVVNNGTLILAGANTYTGGTLISAGTLQVGDGGTAGAIAGDVTDNTALFFNRSDAITYAGAISGTGSLTQVGSGTLILTGANTYTGGTVISSGTLQVGGGGTTGSIAGDVLNNGALVFNRSDAVTYTGAIFSSGSLTQAGSGTLILTGANTYSGGTTISAGTLQIGNGGTTGSVTGNIANNGTLAFNRSNSLVYGNTISGTGGVSVGGGGTVIFTGSNTYTGRTSIAAGSTLQIGDGGTTGSIVSDVVNQGILAFDRSDTVTFTGNVTGNGTLVQNGTGKVIVTTNYTGKTIVNSGTLQIGNGSSSGTVTGNIVNNATVVYGQAAATTYTGVISGTGGVNVAGGGVVILNGSNTYTGPTTITAGSLIIGDSTHPSAGVLGGVTLGNNGLIGGYGTIGGNLIAGGGIVSPGNSIGTLTVAGNYTQSASSTLAIEISPSTSDKLVVGGTAQLGGTLALSLAPGDYGTRSFAIVTAGSISGTFATVNYTGGASGMVYGVVYAPKEVEVAMAPKTSGQIYGDLVSESLDTAVVLNRATLERVSGASDKGWTVWSRALAGASRTTGSGTVADFNSQLWGVISGVDYGFGNGAKLSGVFSYTRNLVSVHGANDKATADGYFFAVAGHIPVQAFRVDLTGFVQHNVIDVARRSGNADSHTTNLVGGGSVQVGYPLQGGDILPFARLTVASLDADGFTESQAAGLALGVGGVSRTAVRGMLGIEAVHVFTTENGTRLEPRLTLGLEEEFGDRDRTLGMRFAGTAFGGPAATPSPLSILVGTGLTAKMSNRLDLHVGVNGRVSNAQQEGILDLGMRYAF